MAGEGILEDDLCLQKVPPRFDDCVFQIFPDQQYSAARELLHFKETSAMMSFNDEETVGGGDDDEEGGDEDVASPEQKFKKMLRSLERAHESEREMNKKQFEQYLGTQIKFGAKMQLLHRKSQKFLTVNKGVTAKHETENLKVYLDKDGSEYSWFNASPFFGIDREGNDMESNAKIKLIVNARESEGSQIHIADSTFSKSTKDREVNCSINQTGWQMSLYSEFFQKGDLDLCAGEIVQLHDPEGDNYLRLKEVADAPRVDAYLQSNKIGSTKTNTNFLWMIERHKNPAAGGKIAYGADTYRLRHLNTGKYLCCRSKDRWAKSKKVLAAISSVARGGASPSSKEAFVYASIDSGRRKECGLYFHSANPYVAAKTGGVGAAAVFIQDNAPIQIQSAASDRYLHISADMLEDEGASPTFKTEAIAEKVNPRNNQEFNMCLRRFEVSDAQLTDIMVGVAGLPYLKDYLRLVEKHTTHAQLYEETKLKAFKKVLNQLILFLAHLPMSIPDNQGIEFSDVDEKMKVLSSADMEFRQQLLQEQGVLTTVVTILELLNDNRTMDIAASSNETPGVSSSKKASKKAKGVIEFEVLKKEVSCASLRLLYLAILDNPESQMDLADHLSTLIGYVPIDDSGYATECITHMLSTNAELQESKVKTKDIENFITMIRNNPLSASYLELLRSVCSCGGNGIDANQGRVVDMWLDQSKDLSMQLALDERMSNKNEIMPMHVQPDPAIYRGKGLTKEGEPDDEDPGVLGAELLESGIPNLVLSWRPEICPSPSLEVQAISGGRTDGVPLLELFQSGERNKKRIQDYFIAQMYLAAETCLDRNYCAMKECKEQFPYNWLVGIMKNDKMPQKLKAACTRLVNTLYVDRGPQVLLRVPRLTYAMNEIQDDVQLASCKAGHENKFYLLTDLISQNINHLKESGWDQFTRQQMALLLQLVRFNFYNSHSKLAVITDPLIRALDCRDQDPLKMSAGDKTMELTLRKPNSAEESPMEGTPPKGVGSAVYPAEGGEGPPEEQLLLAPPEPFQGFGCEKMLWNALDSILWLVIILLLVIVGVTLGFCQMGGALKDDDKSVELFEYVASATFLVDLVLKFWCYPFVFDTWRIDKFLCDGFKVDWLNWIDVIVVLVDIVMYSVKWSSGGDEDSGAGGFAKLLRFARLIRLTRLLKAARLVNKITEDLQEDEEPEWEKPARYRTTPKNQLDTMLQMIRILAEVGDLTRDYTLGLTLSELKKQDFLSEAPEPQFKTGGEIVEAENGLAEATELYKACQGKGEAMSLQSSGSEDDGAPQVDSVFLDICLYEHGELVQSALNVLMNHHSSRQFLLTDLQSTQLLTDEDATATGEFIRLREYVLELRNMAEEQELWGELESEHDYEESNKMKRLLRYVTEACYERTSTVNFYSAYAPIKAKQDMIRNLGGFETAMTILGLHESIEDPEDDADEHEKAKKEEVNDNTLDILRLCNIFLSWFISGNAENQELAHEELDTFMDTLEDEIGSGLVIAAIIRGNSELIRQIPLVLISETTERIVTQGFNPEYLSILEAMVYLEDFDGANNTEVQSEICKNLTRQGIADKTLYLCQDPDGEDYSERMGLMSDAQATMMKMDPMSGMGKGKKAKTKDITIDEDVKHLDGKLKYHCRLLDVLAGCAIGRLNVTTVETKLQALYTPDQCLMALLDPNTSLDVLGPLAAFFFHAVVEVEIAVTGMMQNMLMWEFLERIPKQLSSAASILNNKMPNSDVGMACADGPIGIKSRQQLVYTWFCIRIYTKFFEDYYQPSLRSSELADDLRQSPSSIRYYATRVAKGGTAAVDVSAMDDAEFAEPTTELDAENALDMSSVDSGGDDATLGLDSEEEEEEEEEEAVHHWIDELIEKLHGNTMRLFENYKSLLSVPDQKVLDEAIHALRSRLSTLEGIVPHVEPQAEEDPDPYQEKLDAFVEALADDEDLEVEIGKDRTKIAAVINELPKIRDFDIIADLRFEPLVESLVGHVLSRLENDGTKKTLDAECTKTSIWLIQVFRRMIEDAWGGMTIDERDDDGGEEQDIASEEIVSVLDKRGVTCLCLDLIAVGIDTELILECVNLCVALLFKEGGATMVQETMNKHLTSTNSELFFRQVKNEIGSIKRFYEYEDIPPSAGSESLRAMLDKVEGDEDADPVTPSNIRVLRFLQLMSEGHFEKNQDLMRVQPGTGKPINLLNEFVDLLNSLSKKKSRAATAAAMAVSDVILEVIQGPCKDNQDHFARSTELIEIMMRVLRESPMGDCEPDEDDDVKQCLLEVFEGLTEGQGKPSEVSDKILSVLDLDVLSLLIQTGDGSDELTDIQIEGLVLLQMFMDYDPEIASQVRLPRRIRAQMNKEVISVEVVWNGKLQRRFFPVPSICQHIAEATKDALVEAVNRESQDAKLQDFIARAQDIYREVQHQQNLSDTALGPWEVSGVKIPGTGYLERFNLAQVFSRTNQENITWCSFFCALTINFIFLFTMEHKRGWVPGMGPTKNFESGGFYSTYKQVGEFDLDGHLLSSDV